MKKNLMAVAFAVSTAIAAAQADTVTFTRVLDTATPRSDTGSVFAATYVPGADKFIASKGGDDVEVFNAATGAYETNMSLAGVTIPLPPSPNNLGIFALTASEDGVIYGYENHQNNIWRWGAVSDPAPQNVYTGALFARVGYTGKVGNDVAVAFTGGASYGSVQFFSDTFPFSSSSFVFNESVDLDAKSGLAMNSDASTVFTVGDAPGLSALSRFDKTGDVWNAAPTWRIGTTAAPLAGPGAGPMAYDEVHDILFLAPAPGTTLKLTAYDGADGTVIGEADLANALSTTGGYSGGWVTPNETGGRVYLIGRGATATSPVMYVYDYVVEGSSVNDWSLYQQ